MEINDNPVDFRFELEFPNAKVVFLELMEICQGGPVVGFLNINGRQVSYSERFGGPVLYEDGYIYAPLFIRKFFVAGFKLCRIKIASLEIEYLSNIQDLFYLDRIDGNRIYFFEDVSRKKASFLEI